MPCSSNNNANLTHLITNKLTTQLEGLDGASQKDIFSSSPPYATINNASLTLCFIDLANTNPVLNLYINDLTSGAFITIATPNQPEIINLQTTFNLLILGLTGGTAPNLVSVKAILSIVYTLDPNPTTASIDSGCCA
ncbi:MAG: hypothetical protein RLZ12_246 [Bacillota bacterium]|jgi:hypothetical protein